MRLQRRLRIASAVRRMAGHKVEPVAGERGAHAAARQSRGSRATNRHSSAAAKASRAAIRRDNRESRGSAAAAPPSSLARLERDPPRRTAATGAPDADRSCSRANAAGRQRAPRPFRSSGNGGISTAFRREQPRAENPPLRRRPQERQTPRPADGTQEILDQTGNERGLAGPAEPGNGETQRAVTDQRRQVRQHFERVHRRSGAGPPALLGCAATATPSRAASSRRRA